MNRLTWSFALVATVAIALPLHAQTVSNSPPPLNQLIHQQDMLGSRRDLDLIEAASEDVA